MINPEEVTVTDALGAEHKFTISTLPAIDGRYVLSQYPVANMPKTGDYEVSKKAMLTMMKYVGKVQPNGELLQFTSEALVNNHVPDAECLIRLEIEMLKKNTSFFQTGSGQSFLDFLLKKLEGTLPSIIRTLTRSLEASLRQDSQPTPNSKPRSASKKRSTSGKSG